MVHSRPILFYDQDFKRSIYYSNLALQILQGSHDTERVADCMSYLSVAYTRISDYANAISYAKEVLAIDRKRATAAISAAA